MKPEDVMKVLEWLEIASKNMGCATLSRDEVQGIVALFREKDAEIERLKQSKYLVGAVDCCDEDFAEALKVIGEKDAEIERYRKIVGDLVIRDGEVVGIIDGKETRYIDKSVSNVLKTMAVNRVKADTARKMQERLKECAYDLRYCDGESVSVVEVHCIDRIAKEVVEDRESDERSDQGRDT